MQIVATKIREFKKCVFLILITVTIITVIIMTFIMVSVNHVRVKLIKIASIVIPQRISELMNVFIIVSIYFDRKYFDHVSTLNFSAFWRHWQSLIRNNSSIANALKFKFSAYAFTWQILLRKLFALKFKTPFTIFYFSNKLVISNSVLYTFYSPPHRSPTSWLKVTRKFRGNHY